MSTNLRFPKLANSRGFLAALLLLPSAWAVSTAPSGDAVLIPGDADLWDLDHGYAYKWKVAYILPEGEEVTFAKLEIKSIDNWYGDPDKDILYIDLLNINKATGGLSRVEDKPASGDWWQSKGLLGDGLGIRLDEYTDEKDGGKPTGSLYAEDYSYTFGTLELAALTSYLRGGTPGYVAQFALAFDPDCHYYNCGVKFTIETEKISTPDAGSTAALMIPALGALAYFRRRS